MDDIFAEYPGAGNRLADVAAGAVPVAAMSPDELSLALTFECLRAPASDAELGGAADAALAFSSLKSERAQMTERTAHREPTASSAAVLDLADRRSGADRRSAAEERRAASGLVSKGVVVAVLFGVVTTGTAAAAATGTVPSPVREAVQRVLGQGTETAAAAIDAAKAQRQSDEDTLAPIPAGLPTDAPAGEHEATTPPGYERSQAAKAAAAQRKAERGTSHEAKADRAQAGQDRAKAAQDRANAAQDRAKAEKAKAAKDKARADRGNAKADNENARGDHPPMP